MRRERKILWICAVLALLCGMAGAQDAKKENRLRTVRGVVTDKSEKPIANAIVFLASSKSSFTTGQVLFVDGGKSAT